MNERRPLFWMILFGIVRHLLTVVGTYLLAHGLIDADTHARILGEGATKIVGWILLMIPFAWSWLQKSQVWGWVKTALHMRSTQSPNEVPIAAPGPDIAI